jgi:uncharacterized protein
MGLNTMTYESFSSQYTFLDSEHFPNGIQKRSDFTQIEVDVLSRCGHTMKQLYDGLMKPENEDQKRFLAVVQGQIKPLFHIEYVFLKYLSLIQQK